MEQAIEVRNQISADANHTLNPITCATADARPHVTSTQPMSQPSTLVNTTYGALNAITMHAVCLFAYCATFQISCRCTPNLWSNIEANY